MKIILSRKGFDSAAGGDCSPILPDGELLSLPIPSSKDNNNYSDVLSENGTPLHSYMTSLNINPQSGNIEGYDGQSCHLDPDIRFSAKANRSAIWNPAFGAGPGATTHLIDRHGVGEGDLFLFFGWFRQTCQDQQCLSWANGNFMDWHVIYGYLQVGKIFSNMKCLPPNLQYHPHAKYGDGGHAIFAASENLSFLPDLPGAGVFKFKESLKLTKDGLSRSRWGLDPSVFGSTQISYHSQKSWKTNNGSSYFQSARRGQEFVIDANGNNKIMGWLDRIFC